MWAEGCGPGVRRSCGQEDVSCSVLLGTTLCEGAVTLVWSSGTWTLVPSPQSVMDVETDGLSHGLMEDTLDFP